MEIRAFRRALIAAMVSSATVAGLEGCSSARRMSAAQAGPDGEPKQYQWSDMSQGKGFQGGPKTTPSTYTTQAAPATSGTPAQ